MSGILLLVLYFFWSGQDLSKCCILLTLELTVKEKRRKLILHKNLFKVFIFLTWPKIEAAFSQNKGSNRETNLLCDRKYNHEVEENHKVLAPIIDIPIRLGRLGLSLGGNRNGSKYHTKAGEYSTGGIGSLFSVCSSG